MCEVRNTVAPRSTLRLSVSRNTREATASTPSKGSSRKSSSGLGSRAAASASFFLMPCENSRASFLSSWSSSIIVNNCSVRSRTIAAGSKYMRPMKIRYSRAVRFSNKARFSGTTPRRRLTSRARATSLKSSPRSRIAPEVGASRPVSILIVVDLPAPLGPRKP